MSAIGLKYNSFGPFAFTNTRLLYGTFLKNLTRQFLVLKKERQK